MRELGSLAHRLPLLFRHGGAVRMENTRRSEGWETSFHWVTSWLLVCAMRPKAACA